MALFFNILALLTTVAVAWLYLFGIEHSLFWVYPWFDVLLHFAGGLVMGLWACAVCVRLNLSLRSALLFLGSVALVGSVAWEVFEQVLDLAGGTFDTFSDLFFGVAGALAAFFLYVLLKRTHV